MTGLPGWLEPLPDAVEQRRLDDWAIREQGIPSLDLMERAGAGLARITAQHAGGGEIVVVCGKGNNAGDGLVAARHLGEDGHQVRVLVLAPADQLSPDAAANLDRLQPGCTQPFSPDRLTGAAAIIDSILGTGSSGEPRGTAAEAIAAINRAGERAQVIACDVPSGVDASTGEVAGEAVLADATVTFNAGKPGLWIAPGKSHAGELTVIDIGIPARDDVTQPAIGLIKRDVIGCVPRRGPQSTKFSAGAVLVCGGSAGLTGAPSMAALAAARAGAGYVTVAIPASLAAVFAARLLEVMVAPLPDDDGALSPAAVSPALERAARVDSVVLGPGLGRESQTMEFTRDLAAKLAVPLVLDADALGAHAGSLEALAVRGAPTVLTPHAGELGRVLGIGSAQIGARRLANARKAAAAASAVVVLKGDDTLVAEPDGLVGISRGNAPMLATAGTGDVLAGMIGAYLSKRMDAFTAACAAVYLHAEAARVVADELGREGIMAGDVISALPRTRERVGG
jgi:NAD(P)H-hydrate epimerase